jgi:raffinose/stachyose/melibiose transport system substrate-binding protein
MKKLLKGISLVLAMVLLVSAITACGVNSSSPSSSSSSSSSPSGTTAAASPEPTKAPVTITYATFTVGADPAVPLLKQQLADFAKSKAGEGITVNIEEVPGTDAYSQKIRLLISSGDLPDVIQPTGANLMDMALKAGKIQDLTPYFDADPTFKAEHDPASLAVNSRNGKIYGVPCAKEVCYINYNKELFQKAGITDLPQTWDQFWQVCDKLKTAGITPVAMDTNDFAWCTSLFLCALIGTNGDEGNKWMNIMEPKDYNTPEVINAVTQIQKMLQNYTTKDAIGAKYDNCINHFYQGDVAMIANGPWMISDLRDTTKTSEGFYDKIGIMPFPGNGIVNVNLFGFMVGSKTPEKTAAAVSFIRYICAPDQQITGLDYGGNFPESPKCVIPDTMKEKNPLQAAALALSQSATCKFTENQANWYPNTLDVLTAQLPQLAFNKITPTDLCKLLTEAAQKNTD